MRTTWKPLAGLGCLLAVVLAGCAAPRPATPAASALRVGVTPDSPPYAFVQGGQLVGLEVDFARELAATLGRPLRLVDLPWTAQTRALLDGQIDIIMSGMTITRARQVRIAFSDPYLRSGLVAAMRRAEVSRYPSPNSVLTTRNAIGVVEGTTGDRFVRERCQQASVSVYPTARDAVNELLQRRIDLFVHDAPVVLWYVSGMEAGLGALLTPLNQEPLGWGLRQTDAELLATVNAALARWTADGTRARILGRWVPYWERLETSAVR